MNFVWFDYNPNTMRFIENWLDENAVKSTGLDEGFRFFYEYWANEDGFVVGKNFWCKVAFENDKPLGVIAISQNEHKTIIMEVLIAPDKRGQGKGSTLLKELLNNEEILGFRKQKSEAGFSHPDYRCHSTLSEQYRCSQKGCDPSGPAGSLLLWGNSDRRFFGEYPADGTGRSG